MERVFEREWRQARRLGWRGLLWMWAAKAVDWLISVPREWLDVATHDGRGMMTTVFGDFVHDVR